MTLISDVAAKLISLGYATAGGTDIFAYRYQSVLNCILVLELFGKIPDEEMGGNGVDYPGFQVQVRNTSIQTAHDNAEVIRLALNGLAIGDYTVFTTRSAPQDITSVDDLQISNGPVYRFSVDFETLKAR